MTTGGWGPGDPGAWGAPWWAAFVLGQAAVAGLVVGCIYLLQRRRASPPPPRPSDVTVGRVPDGGGGGASYVPFSAARDESLFAGRFLVVDATHPEAPALTHHKGGGTQGTDVHADTSGEIVLRAIERRHPALELPYVTCDHFDIDGLSAIWAACNPAAALELRGLLVEISTIGDFRELDLSRPHADHALRCCCWLNTVERTLFYRPFDGDEGSGSQKKYEHFLPRFGRVLRDPDQFRGEWEHEYNLVRRDCRLLAAEASVRHHDALGLVVIHAPRPVHYYALFSLTRGYDVVLAVYPGNRFELECKYTAFVDLASRPVLARVSMAPLARVLNRREPVGTGATWESNRFVEAGPLLRLERPGERLTKAQRYGHACDRPIHASAIAPDEMERYVVTWLQHGLVGAEEPKQYWTWEELHRHNKSIDWGPFYEMHGCSAPPDRLAGAVAAPKVPSRRRRQRPASRVIQLH